VHTGVDEVEGALAGREVADDGMHMVVVQPGNYRGSARVDDGVDARCIAAGLEPDG